MSEERVNHQDTKTPRREEGIHRGDAEAGSEEWKRRIRATADHRLVAVRDAMLSILAARRSMTRDELLDYLRRVDPTTSAIHWDGMELYDSMLTLAVVCDEFRLERFPGGRIELREWPED
jgi:hypothetical protein